MIELREASTQEGSQPISGEEICEQVLGTRSGWGPKPKKSRKDNSLPIASSSKIIEEQRNEIQSLKARVDELEKKRQNEIDELKAMVLQLMQPQGDKS